jgi:hypothetical protein
LGYDAYHFQKEIPEIVWTDEKTGGEHKMGEFFTVAKVTTVQ